MKILCTAIIFVILTACSAVDISLTDTRDEPYEIIWYHINAPQNDTDKVFNEVNKYTLQKINAQVTMKFIDWNEYDNAMKAVISSGEKFDICFTSSWTNNYFENASKGNFMDITNLLKTYGKKIFEHSYQIQFEKTKINGKNYAVSCKQELAHQFALIFNNRYVEKYNFDIYSVTNLEDIEPMLKIIKENEPDVIPYAVTGGFNHSLSLPFDRLIENTPGSIYYDNRTEYKVINELETEEYKSYFSLMHKWYKLGYIPEDASRHDVTLTSLENKGNWFTSITSYVPHEDKNLFYRYGYKIDIVTLNNPIIKNRDVSGSMLAISSTSQNPEKAMEFIELLYSDKYLYNLVTFGIEGLHYIKNPDGTIYYPEGATQFNSEYSTAPFTTGNMMLSYLLEVYPLSYFEDYETFNSTGIESPILGFWFDPKNVQNELSNISSLSREFLPPLTTGTVDPDVFLPLFISKLKDAGLQKLLDEQQKQLDEWLGK